LESRQEKVLELLNTHGRRLHRLLARLTRNADATSDLMQELFLRLSRSKGLDQARDPFAYVWRAAANLAFEWRRRQKIRVRPQGEGHVRDAGSHPLGGLIREEQLQRVLEATARLEEPARNVIVLRFIEQESYQQMALRLGKDEAYLRLLCSRTLVRLRQMCADPETCRREGGAL
jgi:RNA polymerase sigma-70 factor (ECF subfamily)